MSNIKLVDCTLRDGGYINNWNFGFETIKEIVKKLVSSKIDAIEIGFFKNVNYNKNQTIFSSVSDIKEFITPKDNNIQYIAMLDMSDPFPIEKIEKYDGSSIDAFRIIFKKNKIHEAAKYCEQIQKLGYKVFIQLVGTDSYTESELINAISLFNPLNPNIFSIVDTFGVIKKKMFMQYVNIANKFLNPNIALGYHSHNNLQQAFGNAEALTELTLDRDLYIDACVFGMGRGAGNLNLELFAEYMNENFKTAYRIEPILEIIDEYLNEIFQKNFWGYSLPFYLSASTGSHPYYASFYADKGTLTLKSFRELLKSIPIDDRRNFSTDKAEHYYSEYLQNYIDDKNTLHQLKSSFENKNILILAPGMSLESNIDLIENYVYINKPIVISVNFISDQIKSDFVFSSNIRRYRKLNINKQIKTIITSNIREKVEYDYMVNFSSFACEKNDIIDNSGIMLLNLLVYLNVKNVVLVGFDGYSSDNQRHYVYPGLEYNFGIDMLEIRNQLIKQEIKTISEKIQIEFLTPSFYS